MDTVVLNSLPNLTPDELREVRDRASVLLTIGPKRSSKTTGDVQDDFVHDLYVATSEILYKRTQVKRMPFKIFSRTSQYRDHYLPAAKAAESANEQWFQKQTRAERLSMVRLYAKLAIDYLDGQGRPAVWYNLAAAFTALPEVVDSAFPGYATSGLLGKVQALRTRPK